MTFRNCSYEQEITQALKDGHWPDGCAPELRDHVAECAGCRDLVLVTEAFQTARSESSNQMPAGSASLLWWRAQLRRRNAAAEQVSRPVTVAQIFAWLVVLLVSSLFAASQYNHGLHWSAWGPSSWRVLHLVSAGLGDFDWNLALLIPTIGGLAILSGLVVYLVSEKF